MKIMRWCILERMKRELDFVHEIMIVLNNTDIVYVTKNYVLQDFFDEFVGYTVLYVWNQTTHQFLDLHKTFAQNEVVQGDCLLFGG